MAQETAVHRWDGENARGRAHPISLPLAADGVSEIFETFLPRLQARGAIDGLAGTMHLHASDINGPAGEWLAALQPDSVSLRHEHGKGDVAIRGPASDLLLLLWGRRRPDGLEVHGDASLLERWANSVNF